jgi:hypothetical protein
MNTKNVNRDKYNNYTRHVETLKTATKNTKKEYLESIWDDAMEFQIVHEDKETWLEENNHMIQITGIKDSQRDIIVDLRQVMKNWENYITELYDGANRPVKH